MFLHSSQVVICLKISYSEESTYFNKYVKRIYNLILII